MSGKGGRLGWYARRLASMSPAEIAHRFHERAKQYADARRVWGWEAFANSFSGEIAPWPGLQRGAVAECLTPAIEQHARAIVRGDIELLSTHWPRPSRGDWWRGDLWSLDPISGEHWPGREAAASKSAYRHAHGRGDVKLVWELNRLQFLMPLAVAALRDEDAELAGQISDVIDGWMEANPPYQGVNWTNGIEIATRVIVILFVHSVLADLAPASFRTRLRPFLAAHVRMLARYPSLFSSANNHRVAELAALFIARASAPTLPRSLVPDPRTAQHLEREILKQFHADGVGAEQSPTYAAYSLEWFLLTALCGEANGWGFSSAYKTRLQNAATHLRWMMDDIGRTPAIGDDDEGRVVALGSQQDYLYPAAVCATAARWLKDANTVPPKQLRTLLDAFSNATAIESHTSLSGEKRFPDGGYSVWRVETPRGVMLLAFDHAPLGFLSIAAHGHADALSVWLHLGDRPVLVDAGTYLYHTDTGDRDRFRGTLAHNTLTLDGRNQSRIAGPFNWSEHANARARDTSNGVTAEHDGYLASHGVKHVRRVAQEGRRIEIEDALEGALNAPAAWSAGYLFHPDVDLAPEEGGAVATLRTGARMRIHIRGARTVSIENAEYSPGFSRRMTTKRLVASGEAAGAGDVMSTTIELLD